METLEEKIDNLTAIHSGEEKIKQFLNFDPALRVSLCRHFVKDTQTYYWTVGVSDQRTCKPLDPRDAIDVIEKQKDLILTVPLFAESGWAESMAPEIVNCSAKGEQTGVAQIALNQHGNQHYRSYEIRYWMEVPEVGFVEMDLDVLRLPSAWQAAAHYKGFSTVDGSPTKVEIEPPREISAKRIGSGSVGSYRYRSFWEDADTFLSDLKRGTY